MSRRRRRGLAGLALAVAAVVSLGGAPARAAAPLTVLLDWFVNPDHAPLICAQASGAFAQAGLDVKFVAPADPSMPPRLVAAGYGDIAIASQSTLYIDVSHGLPLMRVGVLMSGPVLSLAAIDTARIHRIADLRGRRIGMANISPEITRAGLATILSTAGLSLNDVKLVNIGDQLTSSLLTHQVDAVPVVRTFEGIELEQHGATPIEFPFEDYGVPPADTFIFVVRRDRTHDPRIGRFLGAVRQGAAYLRAHPQECLAWFFKTHPELNNPLNRAAWFASIPLFAQDPSALDGARYDRYADYLVRRGVIPKRPLLSDYAVEIR